MDDYLLKPPIFGVLILISLSAHAVSDDKVPPPQTCTMYMGCVEVKPKGGRVLLRQRDANGKLIEETEGGIGSFFCSGSLVGESGAEGFLSARHCEQSPMDMLQAANECGTFHPAISSVDAAYVIGCGYDPSTRKYSKISIASPHIAPYDLNSVEAGETKSIARDWALFHLDPGRETNGKPLPNQSIPPLMLPGDCRNAPATVYRVQSNAWDAHQCKIAGSRYLHSDWKDPHLSGHPWSQSLLKASDDIQLIGLSEAVQICPASLPFLTARTDTVHESLAFLLKGESSGLAGPGDSGGALICDGVISGVISAAVNGNGKSSGCTTTLISPVCRDVQRIYDTLHHSSEIGMVDQSLKLMNRLTNAPAPTSVGSLGNAGSCSGI